MFVWLFPIELKMQKSVLFVFAVLLVLAWVQAGILAHHLLHWFFYMEEFWGIQKFNTGFYSDLAKSDAQFKGLHCHIKDDVDRSNCYWKGTSPICSTSNECPTGFNLVCKDGCGDGKCCVTGVKALCCPTPKPATQ